MSSIPPIRPRQVIGLLDRGGVRMSAQFMRWLDELRNAVNSTTAETISIPASTRYAANRSAQEAGRAGTAYQGDSTDRAATVYAEPSSEIATTEYS